MPPGPLDASHLAMIESSLRQLRQDVIPVLEKCEGCGIPVDGFRSNVEILASHFEAIKSQFFPGLDVQGKARA